MVSVQEREILIRFGNDANNPDILKACLDIMKLFSFDAEELYINWETFSYSKNKASKDNEEVKLCIESLSDLQDYIMKNLEKKSKQKAAAVQSSTKKTTSARVLTSSPMISMFLPSSSPISKRKLVAPSSDRILKAPRGSSMLSSSPTKAVSSEPDTSFDNSRINDDTGNLSIRDDSVLLGVSSESGEIISTLNDEIDDTNSGLLDHDSKNAVYIASNFDPRKYKFRIMRQKLLEAADVLDDQIDTMANYLMQSNPEYIIGNPNIVSQDDIIAVGRISPDSPLASVEDSLNKESICLEPSRMSGFGQRIRLNLSLLENYSFFPGQIVAFKGRNVNGKYFAVSEILEIPLLGSPTSTSQELQQYNSTVQNTKLKVVVTAGPYTTNDSLDFFPLQNFIEKLNKNTKPHYIIMFGPFLDYTHPAIVDGSIGELVEKVIPPTSMNKPRTLDEIFKFLITPILKQIHPQTQVIIVPSTRDVISKHPSYPQDSIVRKEYGLSKNFKCFPNPASFELNEILFGTSNNDIFRDLKDFAVGSEAAVNRIDRIANYVLQQRRYYPLFPGSIKHQKVKLITPPADSIDYKILEREEEIMKQDKNVNLFEIQQVSGADLNIPYLGLTEITDAIPDIMIIPSQMKHFARVIKNVVFINPGSFMKPKRAGTFAILTIDHARAEGENANVTAVDNDLYLHDIWRRARVDIVNV